MKMLIEQADGRIVEMENRDNLKASAVRENVLSPDWTWPDEIESNTIITWSGSLGDDLFEAHPRNWLSSGRAALDEMCAMISERLGDGRKVLFEPHCRHVLSDAPSCAKFLKDHENEPIGLAFAPDSLLEPSMLETIEDHLLRMFEMLGPFCEMVILRDVIFDEETGRCQSVPLGDGRIPRDVARELIHEFVPADTPHVVTAGKTEQQLVWLGVREAARL